MHFALEQTNIHFTFKQTHTRGELGREGRRQRQERVTRFHSNLMCPNKWPREIKKKMLAIVQRETASTHRVIHGYAVTRFSRQPTNQRTHASPRGGFVSWPIRGRGFVTGRCVRQPIRGQRLQWLLRGHQVITGKPPLDVIITCRRLIYLF